MRMRLAFVLSVAGCVSPQVMTATPRNVTMDNVQPSTLAEASAMAQQQCAKYDRDAEQVTGDLSQNPGIQGQTVVYRCIDRVTPVANSPSSDDYAKPARADSNERKEVFGASPLFCAVTAPDVGRCFIEEAPCTMEKEKSGAPACEQRKAGSCFTATRVLEGTKETVCAVSIKDCETRRDVFAANPDYKVSTRCGIYRAK